MIISNIVTYPNNVLRKICKPVEEINQEINDIMRDMKDTSDDRNALGIAAPQININKRIIYVNDIYDEFFMINPVLTYKSEKHIGFEEGCLSIPNYKNVIPRSKEIIVNYLDENNTTQQLFACDLLSIIIQHEVDHLNGVLFIDYLSVEDKKLFYKKYGLEDEIY